MCSSGRDKDNIGRDNQMHLKRRSHGVMVESMKGKNHADMREEGAMHEILRMTKGRPVSREGLEGDVDAAVTAQARESGTW